MEGARSFSPLCPPTFPAGPKLNEQPPSMGPGLSTGMGFSSPHLSFYFLLSPIDEDMGECTCCSCFFSSQMSWAAPWGLLAILRELLFGGYIGVIFTSLLPHPPPGPIPPTGRAPSPSTWEAGADVSVWWRSVLLPAVTLPESGPHLGQAVPPAPVLHHPGYWRRTPWYGGA